MFEQRIDLINDFVCGPVMLILLLGAGCYLRVGLRGITLRNIPYGFRQLFSGRRNQGEG